MERKLLTDFLSEEWKDKDWYEIVRHVVESCKIREASCNNVVILIKIEEDMGYNRTETHIPKLVTYCDVTQDLYEFLSNATDSYDCKNGCQLYQNEDGTVYFCITGANFYDKEGNYAGTNEVRMYFKEVTLEW